MWGLDGLLEPIVEQKQERGESRAGRWTPAEGGGEADRPQNPLPRCMGPGRGGNCWQERHHCVHVDGHTGVGLAASGGGPPVIRGGARLCSRAPVLGSALRSGVWTSA